MGANNSPTIHVGDTIETLRHGKATVLEYENSKNIKIKFRNTGHVQSTTSGQIKTGMIRDKSVKQGSVNVGDVFTTNNCGECIVVKYSSSKQILVRFVNSGIEKTFSSSQLRSGNASDKYSKKMKVGDVYPTNLSGPAKVLELLPSGKVRVVFEDGNTKVCARGLLSAGSVLNGQWAHSQETALEKLRRIWGDTYSYEHMVFKTSREYITVTCPVHGNFEVTFDNHATGCGCRECGILQRAKKKTLPESIFHECALSVHGRRYDYSKVVYKNNETDVEIICKEHGSFWQKPEKHKAGQGCPTCAGNTTMTTERFVPLAQAEHGDTYGYGLIRDEHFEDTSKLVPIVCSEHGVFYQQYRNHLSGSGCSKCAKYGFNTDKDGTLYILTHEDIVKVGITNNEDVGVRLRQIVNSSRKDFTLIKSFRLDGVSCLDAETRILKHLRQFYVNPAESFSGSTECFIGASPEYVINLAYNVLEDKIYV